MGPAQIARRAAIAVAGFGSRARGSNICTIEAPRQIEAGQSDRRRDYKVLCCCHRLLGRSFRQPARGRRAVNGIETYSQ